jgi:3-oxoacyl-[acyl-carrier protein] reductase
MDLNDAVVLVTGASRGIGHALALALAREGAAVVCAARTIEGPTERGSLLQTVNEIENEGGRALAVACDVTDSDQVAALVQTAIEAYGRVDKVVNDAGYYPRARIAEMDPQDWNAALGINLTGSFLVCRHVLPDMIRRGEGGSILNISSGSASRYDRQHIAYSVAKAGLDRLTMNLAEEVKEHEVAVNALTPGLVKTEMNDFYSAGDPPEAVIPAALWLLQQEASDFTGRVVPRSEFGQTWA